MNTIKDRNTSTNWVNPVKKTLQEGQPVFGITITVNSVEIASQAANMGLIFFGLKWNIPPSH